MRGFCLGELLPAGDRPRLDATRRAATAWLELERQVWQPGRGHFRARPTGGRIVPPEPPDASVLAPAAAGLLVATGDHLHRHLAASLRELLRHPTPDERAAHWVVTGAAELGERTLLAAAWQSATECCWQRTPADAGAAGRRLDAALFATTGLRLATGAGSDERCVRLRPWLPPDQDRLVLLGLSASGARFDLAVVRRRGPHQDDERDEAAALGPAAGERLRVAVALRATHDGSARTFVLVGETLQYVAPLQPGERITRSLP